MNAEKSYLNNYYCINDTIINDDLKLSSNFGKLIRSFNDEDDDQKSSIDSIQIVEDSNLIISVSIDNKIKIWDLQNGFCLKTINLYCNSNSVSKLILTSSQKFIIFSIDNQIKVLDLNTYESINATFKNESWIKSLCLIPRKQDLMACGCYDGTINIWDLNNYHQIVSLKSTSHGWVKFLRLTNDLSKLISCCSLNQIKLWNLNDSFELINEFSVHLNYSINCLEVSIYDECVLTGSEDETIKVWNLYSGQCLKTIRDLNGSIKSILSITKNFMIASICIGYKDKQDYDIVIYDLIKMEKYDQFSSGSNKYISNQAFVNNMKLLSNGSLLTASANGDLKLWHFLHNEL